MSTWRTGTDQPQNLYEGDRYAGVMFSPTDASRVVDAMNAGQPAGDVQPHERGPRTDHTPVTMAQEIQAALVSASLDIRNVALNVHASDGYLSASILSTRMADSGSRGEYDAAESDRLAHYLAPAAVYAERGKPQERLGTLGGTTRSGIRITIHCQPRMTPEEVAQDLADKQAARRDRESSE